MSLRLKRSPPPAAARRRILAHVRAPAPHAPLPEELDAQEAHDALLTHGYGALAIALHLAHPAPDAQRLGQRLLAAATALAGGGHGGDYRRDLGAASVRAVTAVACVGAWLYACGRAGCTACAVLSTLAAPEPLLAPAPMDEAAGADPAGPEEAEAPGGPPAETPRRGAVEPAPPFALAVLQPADMPAVVPPAGERAPVEAPPAAPAAPGAPGCVAHGQETGTDVHGQEVAAGPVYVHDPADYYVADPAPLAGEAPTGQLPSYFRDWLADEEPPTGTEAARPVR